MRKNYILVFLLAVISCSKSDNNNTPTSQTPPTLLNVLWNSNTSNMPYCANTWVSSPGFSIEIFSNDTYNENTVQHGTWYWLTNPTELVLNPSSTYQTDTWKDQMYISNLTSTSMTMTNINGCGYTFTK